MLQKGCGSTEFTEGLPPSVLLNKLEPTEALGGVEAATQQRVRGEESAVSTVDTVEVGAPSGSHLGSGLRQGRQGDADLARPHLAQEIFEDLDGELLAGAAAIAKAERRKALIRYR